jgi:aspartate racemase
MHKKIGILGGMSPESTIEYYQHITHRYTQRFDDHGYPEIIIYSVSFQPYIDWPYAGQWDLVTEGLGKAGQQLQKAGADFIVIATNTMHLVVNEIQAQVKIPILSLLDAVGDVLEEKGIKKVGLTGTAFTMGKTFYHEALQPRGIQVITPDEDEQKYINDVIYNELVVGKINPESREGYLKIFDNLTERGAEGVILGCTEIMLLVKQSDTRLPLFDSTAIHAEAALNFAIE